MLSDTYYFGKGLSHYAVLTHRVTMLGIGAWAPINDVITLDESSLMIRQLYIRKPLLGLPNSSQSTIFLSVQH